MAHILKLRIHLYIIFGQIIFQNFHQFKAFVGLSDCRTIGPSYYRTVGLSDCRTIGLSDYSYGPVLRVLENWPEKIWSSISFLLLNIIDSNFGQLEISVYTLQNNKKILCISINIYLCTQLPVDPRDQSLFTNLNILILHRGEKR